MATTKKASGTRKRTTRKPNTKKATSTRSRGNGNGRRDPNKYSSIQIKRIAQRLLANWEDENGEVWEWPETSAEAGVIIDDILEQDTTGYGSDRNEPTWGQVYKIARLLLDDRGLDFPETKQDAEALLDQLG